MPTFWPKPYQPRKWTHQELRDTAEQCVEDLILSLRRLLGDDDELAVMATELRALMAKKLGPDEGVETRDAT